MRGKHSHSRICRHLQDASRRYRPASHAGSGRHPALYIANRQGIKHPGNRRDDGKDRSQHPLSRQEARGSRTRSANRIVHKSKQEVPEEAGFTVASWPSASSARTTAACLGCSVPVVKEATAAWRDFAYQNEPPLISWAREMRGGSDGVASSAI